MKFIGDRIRDLRDDRDLKQKKLAGIFSVSESAWSQYEHNTRVPDVYLLKKIAEYFEVSLDFLIGSTDLIYNPLEKEFIEIIELYSKFSKEDKERLVKHAKEIKEGDV